VAETGLYGPLITDQTAYKNAAR